MIKIRCKEHPRYDGSGKPEDSTCNPCYFLAHLRTGDLLLAQFTLGDAATYEQELELVDE